MSRDRISEPGESTRYWCGPNDGGIKRGDRAETGDNEARPTDGTGPGGSGVYGGGSGFPTADPSSEGTADGTGSARISAEDDEPLSNSDLDDLEVLPADDGSLGLTDVGNRPAEDWAADTGPTHTAEEEDRLGWDPLKSKMPRQEPQRKR